MTEEETLIEKYGQDVIECLFSHGYNLEDILNAEITIYNEEDNIYNVKGKKHVQIEFN